MGVDFVTRMEIAVVNRFLNKMEEHILTYKSGGRRTQVDYTCILCRRAYLKEIGDCKVIAGDNVAKQHRVQDDFGDQEAEYIEGRVNDQMVEIEEGSMLCGVQGGTKTGCVR